VIGGRPLARRPIEEPATWMTIEPFWPDDLAPFVARQQDMWDAGHDPDALADAAHSAR
jgi:hypothetical protein